MSRDPRKDRADVLGELVRELQQFHGLGASFFRAAAAQKGMTITDLQVLGLLESIGPMTAGQLADLTGLTTGAITGMLNRLEEAGRVRRERDPNDGRRVIVRLVPGPDGRDELGPMFDSLKKAWEELASQYDDEQMALLLEFLKRSNVLSQQELLRAQAAPEGREGIYSAPLGDITSGRLVVPALISQLTLRADSKMTELFQASFEGSVPDVQTKDGVVTIRYPRRLWLLGGKKDAAQVWLNVTIPWWIVIQGGASMISAELGTLKLAGMEVKGGMSSIRLHLPVPSGVVPIRISGGASEIVVRRPAGVPARVHLKGWASDFVFDEQTLSNVGNDVRLHSPDYDGTSPCYDIDVASSVSTVTITTA